MDIKKPTRPRRVMKSPRDDLFIDHERVPQPDGRVAVFMWPIEKNGWEFDYFQDNQGFRILEGPDQTGGIAKRLTANEIDVSTVSTRSKNEPIQLRQHGIEVPQISDDEMLHAYKYGGILSMRMGWYITPKNDNKRVLKTKLIALS